MGKLERSSDFKEYITSLNFRGAISFLHFNGVIPLNLYNKLKEINAKRNLVLHNLIFKIEKVNGIDLKNYFELCNTSIKELVKEMALWAQFHTAVQGDLLRILDESDKKINEEQGKEQWSQKTN